MVKTTQLTPEQTNKALKRKRTKSKVGKILALAFVYFFLILMYAPLLYVSVYSFTDAKVTGVWQNFSFKTYITLFNISSNLKAQEIWTAAGNTVIVAVLAGLIATILGTLGAIGIFYARKKWIKTSLDLVNQIPIVNAEIVTAVSLCILFVLFKRIVGMERNLLTLLIGHAVLSIPYVVLSVSPKLEQMDPSLYEAAMDLGATQTQALWKVVIPDVLPGILTGFMLSVTLSLDDYVITAFTKPSGFNTISTYVDEAMRKGGLPIQLRALTALLFGAMLIVMIIVTIRSGLKAKKIKIKEN